MTVNDLIQHLTYLPQHAEVLLGFIDEEERMIDAEPLGHITEAVPTPDGRMIVVLMGDLDEGDEE